MTSFSIYSTLYVILYLVFVQNPSLIHSLKPTPRWANRSLVCYGGEQIGNTLSNEVFSLDLYHPWDTAEPLWEQLQVEPPISPRAYFSSAPCWKQGFIINGGITNDYATSINSTYLYDSEKRTWIMSTLRSSSIFPPSDPSTYHGTTSTSYYTIWTVLDTNTWAFSIPVAHSSSPAPRIDHTATLITNQEILIMGGVVFSKNVTDPLGGQTLLPVSMNQLLLYNTATGKWKNFTAGGNIPAPRRGHSAVLHPDNDSIIVFGGGTPDDNQVMLNDVFVLQLENLQWNSPSIIGVPPKPRKYHQANLMDNLMIVTFGFEKTGTGYNDVNILDTRNWQWITTYTPNLGWLSGNISSNSGTARNSSGIYSNPYAGNQDPNYPKGTPYAWDDPNSSSGEDPESHEENNPTESKIKAGVVAGIISGAVVVLGGGIFFIVSKALGRQRHYLQRQQRLQKQQQDQKQDILHKLDYKHNNIITLADLGDMSMIKPDNRSSYAHAYDDGEQHKPNEHECGQEQDHTTLNDDSPR
ncbi:uncharacterized protein BX664DRAFT_361928 [Halteromyces radiatus]|uniref:uncharacterized protein n=1 Tax=Halteromyces radiatus TaxID=101107 RepID=UPI00221E95FF|nr:uncharacterized protein BX664DRAFT_361928 [Halteromyces radiatus]KAI8079752.1 hypothetical protein BX664DRAFT_361928 [Halteromyces radiatus]